MMAQVQARHVGTGPITLGDLPREEMMDHAASAQAWCDEEFERAIHQAVCRGVKLKELSQQATEIAVRMVVDQEAGNLQRAAKRLGVTDRALQLRRASQPLRVTN
jgi:transcriptional regulator with PAS, ATPase and Fis domain